MNEMRMLELVDDVREKMSEMASLIRMGDIPAPTPDLMPAERPCYCTPGFPHNVKVEPTPPVFPSDFYSALGEVLACCIYETAHERYICRLCDADVTHNNVHTPDCEYAFIYTWMKGSMS
jgi:hypothetical protein